MRPHTNPEDCWSIVGSKVGKARREMGMRQSVSEEGEKNLAISDTSVKRHC